MATRLYLSNWAPPYTPATLRGAWDDTAAVVTKALQRARAFGGLTSLVAKAETNASGTWDVLLYRGVSGPLAAQTISGTVDVGIAVAEAAAASDFVWHLHIFVTAGDSDTVRGTLLADYVETTANEWPTGAGAGKSLASAQALASLAVSAGDRLVVEIGYQAKNTVTSSQNGQLRYGTADAGGLEMTADITSGDVNQTVDAPWIEFSGTITEDSAGTAVNVTQHGIMALLTGNPGARITQHGVMALITGNPGVRVTQHGIMVMSSPKPNIDPLFLG